MRDFKVGDKVTFKSEYAKGEYHGFDEVSFDVVEIVSNNLCKVHYKLNNAETFITINNGALRLLPIEDDKQVDTSAKAPYSSLDNTDFSPEHYQGIIKGLIARTERAERKREKIAKKNTAMSHRINNYKNANDKALKKIQELEETIQSLIDVDLQNDDSKEELERKVVMLEVHVIELYEAIDKLLPQRLNF